MIEKSAYCKVSISPIRAENKDEAEIVSQLLFGEVFTINEVQKNWINITTLFDAYSGWIDIKHLKLLSEKELKAYEIAKSHLGMTYQYDKTIGYLAWKKSQSAHKS